MPTFRIVSVLLMALALAAPAAAFAQSAGDEQYTDPFQEEAGGGGGQQDGGQSQPEPQEPAPAPEPAPALESDFTDPSAGDGERAARFRCPGLHEHAAGHGPPRRAFRRPRRGVHLGRRALRRTAR